ncbi:cell division protein SepF [Fructilactobacillus vespulae]|uniref:cell division protein SepF n=1 Tax=Fructilactobacillus vespulae TaxID=1249630 RepID=UPI0039B5ECE8
MAKSIFNSFFGMPDESEIEQNDKQMGNRIANPRKVLPMTESHIPESKITIVEPRIFSDSRNIANNLINGDAILIKMENVDATTTKRILDFLSGVLYSIKGDMQQIDEKVYLCAPNNFVVDGNLKKKYNNYSENLKNDYTNN